LLSHIALLLLYLLVALGIVLLSGRRYLARDRRMAGFVGVLLILLAAGHVRDNSRLTYPFVKWGMYGKAEAPKLYHEYLIRDGDGPVRHYPFSHIAPNSPRSFMLRLHQLVGNCRCTEDDALVDATIEALANIHRERTGRMITQFEVYDVQRIPGSREPGPRTLRYTWRPAPAGAPSSAP
jgi:hypothetical protein